MKVLLVDDEKFAIEGLKNMLNWSEFDGELIGTASNGEEALTYVETQQPDVIISDIKMPIMDGLTLAKTLYDQGSTIEVILLSAHGEFEYAQQAIHYKVNNYILKPITREKINQLNHLLVHLNHIRSLEKQDILHIWNEEFKESIRDGLRQSNTALFDELFSSKLFTCPTSNEAYTAIALQLINTLYEYLSEIYVSPDVLKLSRESAMNDYLDLPNYQEKTNYLITKYYDVLTSIHTKKYSNTDTITSFATSYILKHFSDPNFNISFLADEMNVSLSYLSTVFKQNMGLNLSTYITNLRMSTAKQLLNDLKYSISDIGIQCGYEDSRYFAKLFKKKTGFTPSEYRNLSIQQQSI